jgi:hypothetical protein
MLSLFPSFGATFFFPRVHVTPLSAWIMRSFTETALTRFADPAGHPVNELAPEILGKLTAPRCQRNGFVSHPGFCSSERNFCQLSTT